MKAGILLVILLAAGITTAQAPKNPWRVSFRRAGPVRIGMSLSEVRKVLGDPSASLEFLDPDSDCAYLESDKQPEQLGFMFLNGRVARVDVNDRSVARTTTGARVGDTEQRIKDLYPDRIRVERHHYDPEGHYLRYESSDKRFEIVFETDGQRVTRFRAGRVRATALVEGCS